LKTKENTPANPASGSNQPGPVQVNHSRLEVKAVNKQQYLKQQGDELKDYALEMQIFIDNLRMASQIPKRSAGAKK